MRTHVKYLRRRREKIRLCARMRVQPAELEAQALFLLTKAASSVAVMSMGRKIIRYGNSGITS